MASRIFNLGVEAGEFVFVAALLSTTAVIRRMRILLPHGWAALVPPYAIGSLAMF